MTTELAYETLRVVCVDCEAPLQAAPAWAEKRGQEVYRCPWTTLNKFRVEHEDDDLLIYNCNSPKGAIARRIGDTQPIARSNR